MNNVINYYYNLYPKNIHQSNKEVKFNINNFEFLFVPLNISEEQLEMIYNLSSKMLQYQLYVTQIIPNRLNKLITPVNQSPYILIKKFISLKENITLNDILKFQQQTSFFAINLQGISWKKLWQDKIDYLEYQMNQFGKSLSLSKISFSYYIGLAEMAISLLNFINNDSKTFKTVAHRRITKDYCYDELYNSLNFIIDYKVRDVADYFKCNFFAGININDEVDYYIKTQLQNEEYLLFFIRMLFPTYYFDMFENIVLSDISEKELFKIISKHEEYEEFLVILYFKILKYYNLPEINWFKYYKKNN